MSRDTALMEAPYSRHGTGPTSLSMKYAFQAVRYLIINPSLSLQQAIQKAAIEIAAHFTHDKEAWMQAAIDLRQPYWDWGFQLVPPDEFITKEELWIVNESGTKVKVRNPLLRYEFHPVHPSFGTTRTRFPLKASSVTVRHPDWNLKEDVPALIK